jgi:hypothetical protein
MAAIDIGNEQKAAGAVGQARPQACGGFAGGLWRGKGAGKTLSAGIGDNLLKNLV